VNVYHAGFDDAKVLPKDGCHHQKRGECEWISCGFWWCQKGYLMSMDWIKSKEQRQVNLR